MLGDGRSFWNRATVLDNRFHPQFDSFLGVADSLIQAVACRKEPGRSGTTTPYAWVSSLGSIAIGYLILKWGKVID